jgi:hypothetical protein
MRVAIDLIVQAGLTFRSAAKALLVIAKEWWPTMRTPCANTIQGWLLRISYGQLHSSLPAADAWAWFADLTMTIGTSKVLLIVGCPLETIPFGVRALAPADLYLLHLAVLNQCTNETILPELKAAMKRTGVPRSITTDEGSDIGKAMRKLQQEHAGIAHLLDMAHIGANLLKKRWTADARWSEFLQKLTHTNQRLRQTELAYLLSPRLRDKGRFMSVGVLLRFACRVLYWLDQGIADDVGAEKYGWLKDFRVDVENWTRQQQVVQQTIDEIRQHGWETDSLAVLEEIWDQVQDCEASLVTELRGFATKMIGRVQPEETLPGSTEVLESIFGNWKRMIEAGPSVGLSSLVLAVGASTKSVPAEETQKVLESTPLKKMWNWIKKHVSTTAQKLRTAFHRVTQPAVT